MASFKITPVLIVTLWITQCVVIAQYPTPTPAPGQEGVLRVVSTLVVPYTSEKTAEAATTTTTTPPPTPSPAPRDPGTDEQQSQNNDVIEASEPISANDTSSNATDALDDDVMTTTTEVPTTVTTQKPRTPIGYEGFVPDLMELLLTHLDDYDDYSLRIINATETRDAYDLMMEEVQSGRADVAAAPMTVTLVKEKRVDFTYPFQQFEASMLMNAPLAQTIRSLSDLVYPGEDGGSNYGMKRNGALHKFINSSSLQIHKDMLTYFNKNRHFLTDTHKKGLHLTRLNSLVYIVEGSYADWLAGSKPCNLKSVKAGFFHRQYALAVKQQSALRDKLNEAILRIQHSGEYDGIKEKWLNPSECNHASHVVPTVANSLLSLAAVVLVLYTR